MKALKKILLFFSLVLIAVAIGKIFWSQELKYALPTPVPLGYQNILPQTKVDISEVFLSGNKPALLHFFNPACPCSKFNLQHLKGLMFKFSRVIDFYVVIPEDADMGLAKELLGDKVLILNDINEKNAKACGVYSTPQAVVLTADRALYYRGNYNKSRYCTQKQTSYAEIAIVSLLHGQECPSFDKPASVSYGCSLFENNN